MILGDTGDSYGNAQKTARRLKMKKLVAMNSHGRVIGENHPGAKLLDSEVDQVLALLDDGLSLRVVAEKMQVSKGCIWKIKVGLRRCQTPERFVSVSD